MELASTQFISLLKQFDKPGPRYTSYPTAPLFTPAYTAEHYSEDIRKNNIDASTPLSLYLHIPFCDTLCYFCGCTSIITKNRSLIKRYCDTVKQEIEHIQPLIHPQRKVVQLALGGGTPSYLLPEEISDLFSHLHSLFSFSSDAEVSVEIDPRDLTFEHIEAFVKSGVNRFSIGVQDFDETVQRAVHRLQPKELTLQASAWMRQLGIQSINIDLMYGLPYQTLSSFERTIDEVIQLSPERIAVFSFAYVPWLKPHQQLIPAEKLPQPEEKLQLFQCAVTKLLDAGYVYIGMDHFAKPTDELAREQKEKKLQRNFQGYSTKAGADLYGFGMSAISHFGRTYAQNAKELDAYEAFVREGKFPVVRGYRMTHDDEIRKHVIMRLMCDMEIDISDVEQRFGIQFSEYFAQALEQLQEFVSYDLVRLGTQSISVTDVGHYVIRNIAMCFDAYLGHFAQPHQPVFSRTI